MKQIAVEWLIDELSQQIEMSAKNMLGTNRGTDYRIGLAKAIDFCQQAKEMEKEQIIQQERSYSEEEVGELVYNIIGQYGKHYGIVIDGAKLNELFERFKKK